MTHQLSHPLWPNVQFKDRQLPFQKKAIVTFCLTSLSHIYKANKKNHVHKNPWSCRCLGTKEIYVPFGKNLMSFLVLSLSCFFLCCAVLVQPKLLSYPCITLYLCLLCMRGDIKHETLSTTNYSREYLNSYLKLWNKKYQQELKNII